MYYDELIKIPTGNTIGRTHFNIFGMGAEYTSIFDGNPLSIASFIGSQGSGTIVTIENSDEDSPFLFVINGRVKKYTDRSKCPKLKKYLRCLRWAAIMKKGDLSYAEAEALLRKRFSELRQYPRKDQ